MVSIPLRCAICLRSTFDGDIPTHRLRLMVCCSNDPLECFAHCSRDILRSIIESDYSGVLKADKPVYSPVPTMHNTFIGVVK